MASKMPAARDSNSNPVDISQAERKQYQAPLSCEFCTAKVQFVGAFQRQVADDVVHVEPFFRLSGGSKHQEGCKYNVLGQISIIVRESDGDVLKAISKEQFVFRLLATEVKTARPQAKMPREEEPGKNRPATPADKQYITSSEKLSSYINTAQRVLRVRSACEDNKEIEDVLVLTFDGVNVRWSDFYFEEACYLTCYKRLDRATVKIPLAIQGTINEIKLVPSKGKTYSVLEFVRKLGPIDQDGKCDAAKVAIWSKDLKAFSKHKKGQEVIAFGMWQCQPIRVGTNNKEGSPYKSFVNHEVRLWLPMPSALCLAN